LKARERYTVPASISTREKLILAGLYLSKYNSLGLKKLGFESFVEAFNVIGYALGSKPASIKNYRDEFDPLFPNKRKGWHKRDIRDYCLAVFKSYNDLDFESFTGLVGSFFGLDANIDSAILPQEQPGDGQSSFAQRLITGVAAERYFEAIHAVVPEFKGYLMENTTRFGCGYDFRLRNEPDDTNFLAIEVKGLKDQTGSVMMTPKEHDVAAKLRDRFYLFVVRNFRESSSHQIFKNPLSSPLSFRRVERVTVQVSWLTTV
jgi:hypothetical protein